MRHAAAIGVGLRVQRFFANRAYKRLVVSGDDDDPFFADGMTAPVLRRIEANERSAWNENVTIDNRTSEAGVAAHANTRHQNRLFDLAEAVDTNVWAQNAADDSTPGDDAAVRDYRIERLTTSMPLLGEHELRRGRLRLIRAQRPLRIVQIEFRIHLAEIHAGLEVGVQRSNVAPVLRGFLVLIIKAVTHDRCCSDQRRNDVLAEIVLAVG